MGTGLEPLAPREGVRRFLEHREPSVAESTMRNSQTRLEYFLAWCEEMGIENLNDLTGRKLADFVAWRRPDIAAITLQKQLSTIRMALRWWADIEAVEDGLAEKLHAPETVSERMDVSLEVLYEHYDARTNKEKMQVRQGDLPE